MDQETSQELIERSQAGDDRALEQLLARYRPRLQRWASGRLPRYARTFTDTEDLVQDAMLGTFRNIKAFEHRGEWALQAYLRRAVTNRVRDELRRFGHQPVRTELPDDAESPERSPLEAAVGRELFQRYEQALDSLSEIEREAVIARVELDCSYDEIALLTEKPTAAAARMAVCRSLEKLAQAMALK
jgi:RNA polymerase sigma-70 factor (ECF subfamily)